jgi:catechol 2,3-dioxygenase-like lactoylglutathione lyase family enzyme
MSGFPKAHLSVMVSNLEKSVAFYRDFFGEDPVKRKPGYAKFLPSFAPVNLALMEDGGRPHGGGRVNHLGIQVDSRDRALDHLDRVRKAGIAAEEEIAVNCCYAEQDKFWVTDPDGLRWEVYVVHRDSDRFEKNTPESKTDEEAVSVNQSPETATGAAPCCAPTCCS